MSHRQVADTVEGVARWRLLEETAHRKIEETREAMEWLVTEGLLVQESPLGGATIYRLNPRMTTHATRLARGTAAGRRTDDADEP